MKKRIIALIGALLCCIIIAFFTGKSVGAATAKPGSTGDPLITKSYLDEQLDESIKYGMEKIQIKKGNTVKFSDGATIVIYSGSATIKEDSEFINLSTGELFKENMTPTLYNTYLSVGKSSLVATSNMTIYLDGRYSTK